MKNWIPFLPAAFYAALIFSLSSIPSEDLPRAGIGDKILHFVEYGIFGVLLARGRLRFWIAAAVAFLYAALDEYHQSFVPGRSAEFLDWVADAMGIVAGLVWRRKNGIKNLS